MKGTEIEEQTFRPARVSLFDSASSSPVIYQLEIGSTLCQNYLLRESKNDTGRGLFNFRFRVLSLKMRSVFSLEYIILSIEKIIILFNAEFVDECLSYIERNYTNPYNQLIFIAKSGDNFIIRFVFRVHTSKDIYTHARRVAAEKTSEYIENSDTPIYLFASKHFHRRQQR